MKYLASRLVSSFLSRSLIPRQNGSCISAIRCLSSQVDSTSENKMQTVKDVVSKLTSLVGASSSFTSAPVDRTKLMKLLPKSQEELPVRKMMDSYDSAVIPLSSNIRLREKYITLKGGVRVGRLLEDLDVFAVWLCYKHISNPLQTDDLPYPYTIVTAMVDRIDFHKGAQLDPSKDIRLSGHVSWAGKSSMETILKIDQFTGGVWKEVTRAFFVMVARDPLNQGSAVINKIEPTNADEEKLFLQGELNKIARKRKQQESLFIMPPNESEKSLVHEIFMSMADPEQHSFAPKHKPDGARYMEDTKIKNLILCHPEHRNRFRKVYGGFIMRQALETAYNCAAVHSGQKTTIRHIDDISFRRPVEIGSLLYLNSQVVYTDGAEMQVSTKASMMDPVTHKLSLTNIFHFTYAGETEVPSALPKTYHEAMMFLDGRRHYQLVKGDRRFYGQMEENEN